MLIDATEEAVNPTRFKTHDHVTAVYSDGPSLEVTHLVVLHTDTAYMLGCEGLWRVKSGPFMISGGPATCLGCAGVRL